MAFPEVSILNFSTFAILIPTPLVEWGYSPVVVAEDPAKAYPLSTVSGPVNAAVVPVSALEKAAP